VGGVRFCCLHHDGGCDAEPEAGEDEDDQQASEVDDQLLVVLALYLKVHELMKLNCAVAIGIHGAEVLQLLRGEVRDERIVELDDRLGAASGLGLHRALEHMMGLGFVALGEFSSPRLDQVF